MTEHQAALVSKADRALATARLTLDDGDVAASVNRAYYACFYLAQAALLGAGEQPRTHSGTHNRFAFHFTRTGRVAKDTGRILPHAAEARERADYDFISVTDPAAASDLLRDAERFVAAVRALL